MKILDYDFPDDLLYNKDYSWVKIEDDTATLGVIEPLAKLVKEFVFINMPKKGKIIKRGDVYVSLEAVKWSGHLTAPLSGEVVDINEEAYDEPSIINKDPLNKGWLVKIKIKNKKEINDLLKPEEIQDWVKKEVKK